MFPQRGVVILLTAIVQSLHTNATHK